MAIGEAYVFPGFLTPALTQLSFQSHLLLFSHALAEVRGENTPERKSASTGSRTRNHQVMSPTRSPLSHPGGANVTLMVDGDIIMSSTVTTDKIGHVVIPNFTDTKSGTRFLESKPKNLISKY